MMPLGSEWLSVWQAEVRGEQLSRVVAAPG